MTVDLVSAYKNAGSIVDGQSDATVVSVPGELNSASIAELAPALTQAIASSAWVIVDLAQTRVCDVDGARMFIVADSQAKARGTALEFRSVLPPVRHAFEQYGLDWRIQVAGDHAAL